MKKIKIFHKKLHLTTFFSSRNDPGQLVSDSPPFLPSLKKSHLFLLANKIDLIFFHAIKTSTDDVTSGIKLNSHEY